MIKIKLLLTFIILLILTACGGYATSTMTEPAAVAVGDVLDLPADVDVQTVAAIKNRNDVILIDVREQWEYDAGHIPDITLIPMNQIPDRLAEIPTDKTVIVTCRSGNRSGQVTEFLRQNGLDNVHNMQGGILAWQQAGLAVEQ